MLTWQMRVCGKFDFCNVHIGDFSYEGGERLLKLIDKYKAENKTFYAMQFINGKCKETLKYESK